MMDRDPAKEKARLEAAARIDRMIMSRRQLLKRGGAGLLVFGVGSSLLAACGGGSSSSEATTTTAAADTGTAPAATTAASTEAAAVPAASGTIDFLSWEGYDLPDIMRPWKTTNSVEIDADLHRQPRRDPGEDQGRRRRRCGYDLITYYQGYKPLYTRARAS